jgi:Zn finger protein HypA/HybF involved in hydrogenase expression
MNLYRDNPGHAPFQPGSGRLRRLAARIASLYLLCALACNAAAQQPDAASVAPLRFEGFPDAPAFEIVPRKQDLFFYPCSQCHEAMEPNPEIRTLQSPHDGEINHGRGRIWCMSCHSLDNRDYLATLLGEPVDFDDAYLVCGGCHANRQKDWVFGAHGKRVGNWEGERVLNGCPACHNPHEPAIAPREPKPPPPVRAGLHRAPGVDHGPMRPWERHEETATGEH